MQFCGHVENIKEHIALMTKRGMCNLRDPRERVPWKRRKVFPMPRIVEDAAEVQKSWP